MNYTVEWTKVADTNHYHTAETMYETDGFRIWKGKYQVYSIIYSANEWHLERLSDHNMIHSGKTAKECKGVLEWAIRNNKDVDHCLSVGLWDGVKFDDDFNPVL